MTAPVVRPTEIKLVGRGGQGIVLAGEILAYAAILEGKEATAFASYGSQARGGEVESEVVLSEKEVPCPFVQDVRFLIALSQEGYSNNASLITEETVVILDKTIKDWRWSKNHFPIPAIEIATSLFQSPLTANMVILGAFSALTKVVRKESLTSALKERVKGEGAIINIRAINEGYERYGGRSDEDKDQ